MRRFRKFDPALRTNALLAGACMLTAISFALHGRFVEFGMGCAVACVHAFNAWRCWLRRRPIVIPELKHG